MFVSKKEFDKLEQRVAALERDLKYATTIHYGFGYGTYSSVSVASAVNQLTDHLGLEFKYKPTEGGYTELRKKPDTGLYGITIKPSEDKKDDEHH